MHIKDQVKFHGYPIIEYTVTTVDGYKLGLHRIPDRVAEMGENTNDVIDWVLM